MLLAAVRAAVLDGSVYKEISETPEHMIRALVVVLAASIAFGLGIRNTLTGVNEDSQLLAILVPASTVLVGWVLWTFVAYVIGTRLLGGGASNRLLLRGIGIAHSPGILMVFFDTPAVGDTIGTLSLFWMLAAATVAVREIQGQGWVRAIIPTTIGWILGELVLRAFILQPQAV